MSSKTFVIAAGLLLLAAPAARAEISVYGLAEACAAGRCTPEGARMLGVVMRSCMPNQNAAAGRCVNHELNVPTDRLVGNVGASAPGMVSAAPAGPGGVTVLRGQAETLAGNTGIAAQPAIVPAPGLGSTIIMRGR
ncbi:MAG TPA: hypothetical protein VJR70_04460 [Stellaceae bacterium]|nr:hypothetical protein [Stellaceae bacterium]